MSTLNVNDGNSEMGYYGSGGKLEDIQSVDSHSYPPPQEPNTMSWATGSVTGSLTAYQQSEPGRSSIGVLDYNKRTNGLARWERTLWKKLEVGDIVLLRENEQVPADIVVLSTSDADNMCYLETKNLDGETSLKSRNAVPALTHLRSAMDCASKLNTFRVDCDRPEHNMYKLNGTVLQNDEKFPIDMQMMLLRGTVLRNTKWAIGIVLFTGLDTKIVLNSGGTPSKRSKVESQMNPQVYVFCCIPVLSGMITHCFIGLST